MNPELLRAFIDRGVQLQLMGFGAAERRAILTDELSFAPTDTEWDDIEQGMKTALRDFQLDEDATHTALNSYLRRSEWIQGQLLGVFNSMLRNYNAQSEGRMEHDPDPVTGVAEPVLPVKPSDIAAMGEKILKLDQDRLAATLSYPASLQKAQLAQAQQQAEALPAGGGLAALTDALWDDEDDDAGEGDEITDADFQEAQ